MPFLDAYALLQSLVLDMHLDVSVFSDILVLQLQAFMFPVHPGRVLKYSLYNAMRTAHTVTMPSAKVSTTLNVWILRLLLFSKLLNMIIKRDCSTGFYCRCVLQFEGSRIPPFPCQR